jgi:hypothetical protein
LSQVEFLNVSVDRIIHSVLVPKVGKIGKIFKHCKPNNKLAAIFMYFMELNKNLKISIIDRGTKLASTTNFNL